jgi:hypothetical protein
MTFMDKSSSISREAKRLTSIRGDDEPTASGWLKVHRMLKYRNWMDTCHSFPYIAIVWRLVNKGIEKWGRQLFELSWLLQWLGSGTRSLDYAGSSLDLVDRPLGNNC